jgi:mRNA interferase YafQ
MSVLKESTQFKKDLKKLLKKNKTDLEIIFEVLKILQINEAARIPKERKPHKLRGNYKNNWECHIKPDLFIIWFQVE